MKLQLCLLTSFPNPPNLFGHTQHLVSRPNRQDTDITRIKHGDPTPWNMPTCESFQSISP